MKPRPDTYVLCRPRGGLNDTLCQIERCWQYADSTGRVLVVDAVRSNFSGTLADFFVPRSETLRVVFDPDSRMLEELDSLSCFPRHLRGRLRTYRPVPSPRGHGYQDAESSGPLTFRFRRSYREQVLVHEKAGGGMKSFHFLERVVLGDALRRLVLERLGPLGEGYKAVHVRNTDIRTDVDRLFQGIAPLVHGHTLLVCSDDARVIDRARSFFSSSRVVSVSEVPDRNGAPLHHGEAMGDASMCRKQAVDAIVDLLSLGGADTVYYAKDSVHGAGVSQRRMVSGFSRLAHHLSQNKCVIDALLRRPARSGPSLRWRSRRLYDQTRHGALKVFLRGLPWD